MEDSGLYALAQIGVIPNPSSIPGITPEGAVDVTTEGSPVILEVGVTDPGAIVNQVFQNGIEYARQRAAEMVGKKWVGDVLVENPKAIWRIDEATRNEIQEIIAEAFENGTKRADVVTAIQRAGAFSRERATLIANTEIGTANSMGALAGYKAMRDEGVNLKKKWIADEDPCPICIANEDQGPIDLDEEFQGGVQAPLQHPRCECVLSAAVIKDNAVGQENNAGQDEDS